MTQLPARLSRLQLHQAHPDPPRPSPAAKGTASHYRGSGLASCKIFIDAPPRPLGTTHGHANRNSNTFTVRKLSDGGFARFLDLINLCGDLFHTCAFFLSFSGKRRRRPPAWHPQQDLAGPTGYGFFHVSQPEASEVGSELLHKGSPKGNRGLSVFQKMEQI